MVYQFIDIVYSINNNNLNISKAVALKVLISVVGPKIAVAIRFVQQNGEGASSPRQPINDSFTSLANM